MLFPISSNLPPQAIHQQVEHPFQAKLVERLKKKFPDLDASKFNISTIQPRLWNNSSLGCPVPGENYLQVLTQGYLIQCEFGGKKMEIHTNEHFSHFRMPGVGGI